LNGNVSGLILVELVAGSGPTRYSCQYESVEFVAPKATVHLAKRAGAVELLSRYATTLVLLGCCKVICTLEHN
jgi:hypothetical protein